MSMLNLPAPQNTFAPGQDESLDRERINQSMQELKKRKQIPQYGIRKKANFVPRSVGDFGDGGAFPEIHVPQFPMDCGRKDKAQGRTLKTHVDAAGNVKYDAIAKQGKRSNQIVQASFADTNEADVGEGELARPGEDVVYETTNKTRDALEKLVSGKIAAAQPHSAANDCKVGAPTYVRYTPGQQGGQFNSGAKQRMVRMVELPTDPMEPPKFKSKRIPRGPPSPPVPVLHSPPRKVTAKDQQDWKIPPCVSSWKNPKGYTIPLDKRLATDGRGLQEVTINDNFAKLSEALYIAERNARDEVERRAQMARNAALMEKEKKEQELRALAAKARGERTGMPERGTTGRDFLDDSTRVTGATTERRGQEEGGSSGDEAPRGRGGRGPRGGGGDDSDEDDAGFKEREALRQDRKRERERNRRIEMANPEKRTRLTRDRDRDVSEKVALGMAAATKADDVQYDSRLFNQSQGMDSGFGTDDGYNIYDKKLFAGSSANVTYRPKADDADDFGSEADLEKLKGTSKFKPAQGFKGTDGPSGRGANEPVQYEKETEDPFGLNDFLSEAKKGKGALDGIGKSSGAMSAGVGTSKYDEFKGSHRDKINFSK